MRLDCNWHFGSEAPEEAEEGNYYLSDDNRVFIRNKSEWVEIKSTKEIVEERITKGIDNILIDLENRFDIDIESWLCGDKEYLKRLYVQILMQEF